MHESCHVIQKDTKILRHKGMEKQAAHGEELILLPQR